MPRSDFAVFILTHGRADRVRTYKALRNQGYTGRIVLVVDNEDSTVDQYIAEYGDEVVVFDKPKAAETVDTADNFPGRGAIVFARNASYKIADQLGIRYFVQLDDDYSGFDYRFNAHGEYLSHTPRIASLDKVFGAVFKFLIDSNADCICLSQGGDFIGGANGSNANVRKIKLLRKAMNSFFCDARKPIRFAGRMNEDVCTYALEGSRGRLLLTTNQVSLKHLQTQSQPGPLSDLYASYGTYVKTFYTLMMQPSSVSIGLMGHKDQKRVHHMVRWAHTVPMILREEVRRDD
jgi:hypothetical protein